ncbi:hypothetical protein NDU88_000639, partial [Pleurodeles waltl]
SGPESRFSFPGDAPPGRPSNISAVSLRGNPDIQVPETVEIEDGLRAGRENRGEDADKDERTPSERPEDTEGRPNTREALKTSAQGRIATKRETEGRELRHVPGGTWLNQTHPYLRSSYFRYNWESQEEYLRRSRGNLGKEKR